MPWPDHRGAGPRDEGPRGPGLQKAGSHGSNPVERRSQIPEGAGSRDAICSTATARPREQWPGEHGPSMQVRSQQTSGKQQGAPRSKPLADESCGTWAGLAGRTRNEAEPKQLPQDEETRGIVIESPARSTSDTGSSRTGRLGSQPRCTDRHKRDRVEASNEESPSNQSRATRDDACRDTPAWSGCVAGPR